VWSAAGLEQASSVYLDRLLRLSVGLIRSNSAFVGVVDQQGTSLVDPRLGVASVLANCPLEFSLVSQEEVA